MKNDKTWYAYRPLIPTQKTMFFIWYWEKAYERHAMRTGLYEYFDTSGVLKRKPRPYPNLGKQPSVELKMFESLREFADRQGIPYDLYWMFGYQILETMGLQDVRSLVATSQRFALADLWDERRRSVIITAPEEWLAAKNFQGHSYQAEYRDYLIDSVNEKYGSRAPEVFGWLIKDGHLLPEWV
jgi:hypothetical protein